MFRFLKILKIIVIHKNKILSWKKSLSNIFCFLFVVVHNENCLVAGIFCFLCSRRRNKKQKMTDTKQMLRRNHLLFSIITQYHHYQYLYLQFICYSILPKRMSFISVTFHALSTLSVFYRQFFGLVELCLKNRRSFQFTIMHYQHYQFFTDNFSGLLNFA